MSTELALKIFENIGNLQHLRSYEIARKIEEMQDDDGYSRITYKQWREFGIHAFILNESIQELIKLGFIQIARENKNGIAKDGGGKGTKRIYRLTLENVGNSRVPSTEKVKISNSIPTTKKVSLKRTPAAKKKSSPVKKQPINKAAKKVVKKKVKK